MNNTDPFFSEKPWLPDPSTWKGTWRDDWRVMGQEGYLMNCHLQHRTFDRALCIEDYTQCEFCYAVFDKDKAHPLQAYFEPNKKVWVCENCFRDFQPYFHWMVE